MDQRIAVYMMALDGICFPAIHRTVEKIIKGKIPEMTKFLPTAPELAAVCRTEEKVDYARRRFLVDDIIREQRRAFPEPEPEPDTPEQQQYRDAKVAIVKAAFGAGPMKREPAWFDRSMKVEKAAEMSPELKRVMARKWHIMGPAQQQDTQHEQAIA